MFRHTQALAAAALAALLPLTTARALTPAPAPAPAPAPDGAAFDAKAVAEKALTAGAAMFDKKDARGLADTYTDDAVLTVVTRDKSTGELKKEVRRGRTDIESYYEDFFKGDGVFHAKNTVEFARPAGANAVMIAGGFVTDTQAAEPITVRFVQVRVKKGDAWLITEIQVYWLPE